MLTLRVFISPSLGAAGPESYFGAAFLLSVKALVQLLDTPVQSARATSARSVSNALADEDLGFYSNSTYCAAIEVKHQHRDFHALSAAPGSSARAR